MCVSCNKGEAQYTRSNNQWRTYTAVAKLSSQLINFTLLVYALP